MRPRRAGTIGIVAQETARYTAFATCLAQLDLPAGWEIMHVPGNDVAWARQQIADAFSGDHLLFLDDDHVFSRDLVWRLLAHQVDVVSPLTIARRQLQLYGVYAEDCDGGLIAVDVVGAAGMLVHRRVIDALEQPFHTGFGESEEDAFCSKARAAGFGVWLDTSTVMGHVTAATLVPTLNEDGTWCVAVAIGDRMWSVPVEDFERLPVEL